MATPQVQFITKEGGCSLCDDLFAELESAADYTEFDLEILKIDYDDELREKYWDKIPVVIINGKVAFKYRATRDQLIKAIEGRSGWKFWK
ncbi:MAG: glutaredoxin family protein [Bacteroidetes bacterium]|nr:glutaredoxin family protein [Bacteroidota bacterium]